MCLDKDNKNHLNPLSPCGACLEWLKKIAEHNPDFKVIMFGDTDCKSILFVVYMVYRATFAPIYATYAAVLKWKDEVHQGGDNKKDPNNNNYLLFFNKIII